MWITAQRVPWLDTVATGGSYLGSLPVVAALTALVASFLPYESGPLKFASAAAIIGTSIYAIGLAASFWLPEPNPKTIEE